MSMKNWLTGWVVLFAMVIGVITSGSLDVLAESDVVRQQAMEVQLNDDYFNPETITIPSGKKTTLILKNEGQKEHTFTVEKLGIDAEVQPGKEKTITVKPQNPGTYELICRYHFNSGMVGKVIVK
ncbi:cupredoxin domain-containing protein [Priestia aryabhattai]|uniref:cupredoxin domain-containing protein n=1 Tax=Priestia aryabhattai TaxID=412384 RepID=UPI000B50EEB5|nr:cupredoxin domain-containing protein [Priestia aryabhattai]MBZ6484330.1 cupredoxin domain-containing protein [Priestia aryabhattai]MDH3115290.1 cupredoxin domain-containing protein [Priestia aryabhattai]MDH3125818.1 cupredoxin domain-containing protein [Priestia aryabhattai]MDH3133965.1 cupredoxin domain-containing protein [Priestia aryabhattai]MED4154943.1 cupredoxin domain-containing protein [Priestia aryabhattai]